MVKELTGCDTRSWMRSSNERVRKAYTTSLALRRERNWTAGGRGQGQGAYFCGRYPGPIVQWIE